MSTKKGGTKKASKIGKNDIVRRKLWVRAGARCEFYGCNEYLLDDEDTGYKELWLADVAHVVARSVKGARGKDPLPFEDRNKIENLMLLCSKHHNDIIDGAPKGDFSKEILLGFKKRHEDTIKYLTSLALPGFESVTIRMVGNIRGNAVAIPDEQVRASVLTAGRYPRYLLNKEKSIEINLTGIEEDTPLFWEAGFKKIDQVVDRQIIPAIDDKSIGHLSVFPFARIPFIVYLGSKLGDKVSTDVYQKQRNEGDMWIWEKDASTVDFEYKKIQEGKGQKNIGIILSLSGVVSKDSLPEDIDESFTIYEILPVGVEPGRTIFQGKKTLNSFRKTYQELLRFLEKTYAGAEAFHLFPAVSISAAFHCGRELLKDVTPKMVIYDRAGDLKFSKITEIN